MKAIVYQTYGAPEVLELRETARPTPADNQVLIKIAAATVSSTDSAARQCAKLIERLVFGWLRPRQGILGTEFSGVIAQVGQNVTTFRPGDEVFGATGMDFGAHAEYCCLPEDAAIVLKPSDMSFANAAAIAEGGLTALPFLKDLGNIQAGQRVLINGAAGSVGSTAVQLASYFGAEVTAVCGPANAALVRSLGADKVIDYRQEDFTESGQTYDIIFDTVGKSSFADCAPSLSPNGIYLSTVLSLSLLLRMFWTQWRSGQKARFSATGLRKPPLKRRDLLQLGELATQGALRPVISQRYTPNQAPEAHRYVDGGHKQGHAVIGFGA